jgi:hypothetical protein
MVLAGSSETLKRATLVQFETGIIEYNKGGACWYEVDELLRQYGFYLYDMGISSGMNWLFIQRLLDN